MSAPANVTGDRADRVTAGQWVHFGPLVLGDATPVDGWLLVGSVVVGDTVTFTFDDESTLTVPGNRLVRIGWVTPS